MIERVDKNDTGRFDHVKCPVCGVPWKEHTDTCTRHSYRPGAGPDPEMVARSEADFAAGRHQSVGAILDELRATEDAERINARIPVRITREERNSHG